MMILLNLINLLKELVKNLKKKLIKLLMNLKIMLKVGTDFLFKKGNMILNLFEKYITRLTMLIKFRRLLMMLSLGRKIFIRGFSLYRNLRVIRIEPLPLRNLIFCSPVGNFLIYPPIK